MSQDARVYSIMVEHDRAVPMIEQTTDRAKLDHDLIVPITTCEEYLRQDSRWPNLCSFPPFGGRVLAHLPECCLDQDHKSQATHHYPLWIVSGEGAYRLPYWCSQYCCSFLRFGGPAMPLREQECWYVPCDWVRLLVNTLTGWAFTKAASSVRLGRYLLAVWCDAYGGVKPRQWSTVACFDILKLARLSCHG